MKHSFIKRSVFGLLAALVLLPVVHLAAEEPRVVKLADSTADLLEYVADELGFFEEKGIKAQFIGLLQAGSNPFVALAAGQIDATSGGHSDSVVQVRASGAKVKIILANSDSTQDQSHMTYFVRADSPIRTAADFKGKKIAGLQGKDDGLEVKACTGYSAAYYLEQNGIDIYKANIEGVVLPNPTAIAQALKQGLVDIGAFHPPVTGVIAKDPTYRKLLDDYQILSPLIGRGATKIVAVSEKWLKADPEGVRRFSAALALAADWSDAHPTETKLIFNKRLNLNLKDSDIPSFATSRWIPHGIIGEKDNVQVWIDLMVRYHVITAADAPKAGEVYTNDFNPYYVGLKNGKIKEADILKEAEAIAAKHLPDYIKNYLKNNKA